MATTLSASVKGLEIVDRARRRKGWNKTVEAWQDFAKVSKSTLDRFWMRKSIKHENFIAICSAVGIDDWEQIIDLPPLEPTNIRRTSNLTPANRFLDDSKHSPEILELEDFAQQIFDWFGALDFTAEGLPRRESNYVEWIIQVPQRRARFDRVLIRAIIHETGLGDLDSLRRMVGQLRVDEGWLVTNRWVSQLVRQALIHNYDENLTCLTFDELIDQDANFTPYLEWLEREIKKREIDRYYVDLGCTKGEFDADTRTLRGTSKYSVADGGIDLYINRWLENPVTEHVSILGEFGTGKTWFAFHYAGKCLQAYRAAKSKGMPRPRLPLVIPLRDYAKALDVENVFAGFFYTQHNIRLNSEVFDRLNQMGKLLLIFDGFDEMADKIDTQKMADNFWELAKVVTTNAKVILTCRTEHFPTAQDERENFGGERIPSTVNKIAVAPKFETLELMKFDDEQIRAVLSRRTNSATVELIMANSQLLDLLQRAVMAEFVLEALPEIEAGKPIDLARVYLYAVRHKMERDITTGRTFTSLADKLYFLCELAWEMLSEDKMSLNYREFPDRLRALFKNEVKEQKHLDHWHYDMMGQTMLIRNDDGDYSPAHRSLLEFFVAYKLAAELGLLADDFLEMAQSQSGIDESLTPEFYTWSDYWRRELDDKGERELIAPLAGFKSEPMERLRGTFGKSPLTKAILDLLLPALNLEIKYRESNHLLDLIKSTRAAAVGYLGGNAATVLVKIDSNSLDHRDLSDTNLTYADLVNAGLRGTNLIGANLKSCLTTRVFGSVNVLIMNKENLSFITAHDDNTIRIWDRSSGIELKKLTGHQGSINCLILSEDGEYLYSGSQDRTIKQWKLDDGICQSTFEGHQRFVTAITLSADGEFIYSASNDHTIKEWKLDNGICQRTFENNYHGSIRTIALSRSGKWLYSSGNDRTIQEWNLDDGICQRTFEGHQRFVTAITLSADEQFLYTASGDGTIKEWKLSDGICQRTFEGHRRLIMSIVLSANGKWLYSGSSDGTIKEWKLADGICQRTFERHRSFVNTISLSTDGEWLYSGSHDRTIKEWKLSDGTCQRTFDGHQNSVSAIAVSGDGQLLYSASYDGRIKEWEIANGTCQKNFQTHRNWVSTIAVNKEGDLLYIGSDDGTIEEWKIANGNYQKTFQIHQGWVSAIALSRDGKWLYSSSDDETINEWEIDSGTCQRTFQDHQYWVRAIALSADGKWLYSGSDDGIISEWKLDDGKCYHRFESHQDWVSAIALSIDRQWLYSGSSDGTIKEWKLDDGICYRTFQAQQSSVTAIILNPSRRSLYSGSHDQIIKEWDLTTGECLRSIDYRLCAGANITNVKGLTPAQTDALLALGAISDD
jgi:WD40 repeat protein